MSEVPVPEEVANETANEEIHSGESPKPETEKNDDIQKLFDGFRGSPEYSEGLEKHKQGIKTGTSEEIAIKGYEAQMTTPDNPLLGTGEYYKKAFMDYMGSFYEENGVWPLYFSETVIGPEVTEAYVKYKEAALISKNVEGKVHVLTDDELDEKRSFAHDELAKILYDQGTVETFLDGKLTARLWLVTEGIDDPNSITFMDRARYLRVFHKLKNTEAAD